MRKVLITIVAIIVAMAVIAGILTISYTNSEDYTSDTFPKGITINGLDCSGLTYDEADEALTDEWNSRAIVVKGKLDNKLDEYSDFGCSYKIDNQLAKVKKNHLIAAAINHYVHLPFTAQIAMKVDKCGEDFAEEVKSSKFLSEGTIVETKDAYVDLNDSEFPIIPEVYGNKTDANAYLDDILIAISSGNFIFEFDENAYRSMPKVKADDKELLKYQKFCQKYLKQKISYNLGDESFTLSATELNALMKDDCSGDPDPDAILNYVNELKTKYDMPDGEKSFTSLTGKTCKVKDGYNVWVIDALEESSQLQKDIESRKDIDRAPVFSQKGNGKYSREVDIGDTYVDVDITEQHVVYFENGKQKFETDCVTGCWAAGHSTPTGVFDIKSKGRNITLKSGGKKKDPGYYESFVSYWMPFLGNNYGLHDASWRQSFGGEIYKYGGSHGCVNLPTSAAPTLYKLVSVGTIVIIHY